MKEEENLLYKKIMCKTELNIATELLKDLNRYRKWGVSLFALNLVNMSIV